MRWLAQKLMLLRGWRFAGESPPFPKYVAIGAPHTSNWDFIIFLAVVSRLKLPGRAIGKHSLVRWPFGGLMRRLGIVPIERDTGQGLVEQMVDEFNRVDSMALVIAPEGTRRRSEHWRSGFYHIAIAADVPIVYTFIDGANKTAGVGGTLHPTGDIDADLETIRQFYEPIQGLQPKNQGPIRLRPEAAPGA